MRGQADSFGAVARAHGYSVVDLDNDPSLRNLVSFSCCIREWDYAAEYPHPDGVFDIIWASPCCIAYSRLQNLSPCSVAEKEKNAAEADEIVQVVLAIIKYFKPRRWYIENPVGGCRTLDKRGIMNRTTLVTTSYCKYGCDYQKNTGIWTNDCSFRSKCKPACSPSAPCGWINKSKVKQHKRGIIGESKSSRAAVSCCKERAQVPGQLVELCDFI
jgi:hypothetical protein